MRIGRCFFKVSMLPILPFFEKLFVVFKKKSSYFVLLTGKGTSVFPSFELEWYLDFQSVCILLEAGYYLK